MEKKCPRCGVGFFVESQSVFDRRKFCSRRCAVLNYRENSPPEKQPNWKGGRAKGTTGYNLVKVRKSTGEFIGGRAYALEHRVIMEKYLGRPLGTDEDVHHVNGIKTDNRIENLVVLKKAAHTRHHHTKWHKKPCVQCGKEFKPQRESAKFCCLKCFGKSLKKSH